MARAWMAGDCESLANSEARDGAADVYYERQRQQDAAHLRSVALEKWATHWERVACGLLCEPVRPSAPDLECMDTRAPTWAVARAVRYARCAARVREWSRQARERSQ